MRSGPGPPLTSAAFAALRAEDSEAAIAASVEDLVERAASFRDDALITERDEKRRGGDERRHCLKVTAGPPCCAGAHIPRRM